MFFVTFLLRKFLNNMISSSGKAYPPTSGLADDNGNYLTKQR